MAPTLTVFTPTYNRAYILPACYKSLKNQTSRDFVWLIIDDGSTDGTEALVRSWMAEGAVHIRYHYQENAGMHGAHNTAYELIDTELNVCIDSDDYMPERVVEEIVRFWKTHGSLDAAGIVGLDAYPDGRIIGTAVPEGIKETTLSNLYAKHKAKGDKKLVYRTDLMKEVPPYPVFEGEKYCPLSYKYVLVDQQFPLLTLNKILCHVEYLEDGSSLNMIKQYRKNPRGFLAFRKTAMKYAPTFKERLRESIHYVSSNLMIGNFNFLSDSPCKWVTLLSVPLGIILYIYIQNTKHKTILKNN